MRKININKFVRNISIIAVLLIWLTGLSTCRPYKILISAPANRIDTTVNAVLTDTIVKIVEIQPDTLYINYIPGRIELPEVRDMQWLIQHLSYAMEYDTAQRHSLWVAYKFYDEYNQKIVKRSDAWAFDPVIPKQYQSLNSPKQTFAYIDCDRGHLCASEDRVFNLEANKETFYYSNMSPQLSWFNKNIWKNLEEKVRKWAQALDCDTLYVVTGGAINPEVETLGTLPERNNVTIPKYYFKALVKRQGDTFDGIAYWLENKKYNSSKVTHEYSMTIRKLEELTGINFFPYLRHIFPENPLLEDWVETNIDIEKWPL